MYRIDEILKVVSELELARFYLGVTRIPTLIKSPIRDDRKPSFSVYYKNGHVKCLDFSTGWHGGLIDCLMAMWNRNFYDTIDRIGNDFFISPETYEYKRKRHLKAKVEEVETELSIKTREWKECDESYWSQFGISIPWLKWANVHPISNILLKNHRGEFAIVADRLSYAFAEFKENRTTYKIYQPLNNEGHKWYCNHDKSVVSLWSRLPDSAPYIVICSSLKDALCIKANMRIPTIAPQGEGYPMSDTAVNVLKERFERIFVLYDNDEAGLKDGRSFSERYGFTNIVLPRFDGGKDVSDLYKSLGDKVKFKRIINKLINDKL